MAARDSEEVDYSPRDDFNKSVNECYRAIKERVASGGPNWNPNRCPTPRPPQSSPSENLDRGR